MKPSETNPAGAPPLWELEQHVILVTAEQIGVDACQILPGSRLLEDLGVDSLAMVELIMALEQTFVVTIPENIGEKMFVREPLTISVLAQIVKHQWGTGTPERPRWFEPAPPRTPALPRVFTQFGGVQARDAGVIGPMYTPLGDTDEGTRQWQRRTDGMRCVLIPGAEVELGSESAESAADERPLHSARIEPFLIDAEPVSVLAFARFLNSTVGSGSRHVAESWCVPDNDHRLRHFQLDEHRREWMVVPGAERQPMVLVSWFGAAAYSLWAHGRDWRMFRTECCLPSEAQWEYAARGPRSKRFPWGDADCTGDLALTDLHRVRERYPDRLPLAEVHERLGISPFGVQHMAGNVWNWCADWYAADFYQQAGSRLPNPQQVQPTGIRSERGGSWVGPANLARSSFRRGRPPRAIGRCLGFRCAVPLREVPELAGRVGATEQ